MKTFFSALTKAVFALLIVIQKDVDGGPLINANAHLGLAVVAIGLVLWAILQLAFQSDEEYLEEWEDECDERWHHVRTQLDYDTTTKNGPMY